VTGEAVAERNGETGRECMCVLGGVGGSGCGLVEAVEEVAEGQGECVGRGS